jgi:mono/diheme cytochrome c family protein
VKFREDGFVIYDEESQRMADEMVVAEARHMAQRRRDDDCACKDGMFPRASASRRGFLFAAGSAAGLAGSTAALAQKAPPGAVYYNAYNCAACHGDKGQGNPAKGIGGDRMLGGRGTLASDAPIKTVESYWPYATTLFDYVKRAMPLSAPGSLSDNDVYAVVAYLLSEAKIIKPTDTMNAATLPKVMMPNRDGFVPDPPPELELYH